MGFTLRFWEGTGMDEVLGWVLVMGVVIGIPSLGWVVTEIVKSWQKVRVSEHLAALKQTMVQQGMSADEIERVIRVGVPEKKQLARTS